MKTYHQKKRRKKGKAKTAAAAPDASKPVHSKRHILALRTGTCRYCGATVALRDLLREQGECERKQYTVVPMPSAKGGRFATTQKALNSPRSFSPDAPKWAQGGLPQ
jgi:hypothetical protein